MTFSQTTSLVIGPIWIAEARNFETGTVNRRALSSFLGVEEFEREHEDSQVSSWNVPSGETEEFIETERFDVPAYMSRLGIWLGDWQLTGSD